MIARCKSASRYQGIFMPKCDCLACWSIYSHALRVRKREAQLERAKAHLKRVKKLARANRKSVLQRNFAS